MGAGRHQFLEHLADDCLRFAHLAIELAVGEGAGSTFSKLGIRFRVERLLSVPEAEGIAAALLHGLAALQQQGPQAHLGQQEGGEVAAGACPHHHRAGGVERLLESGHEAVIAIRCWP